MDTVDMAMDTENGRVSGDDGVKGKMRLLHGLGVVSVILLAILLAYAAGQKPRGGQQVQPQEEQTLSIQWQPDTLVYDGTGTLNLMEGVFVTDEDGNDRTADTRGVLQGTDVQNKKLIYYTVTGNGQRLTDLGRVLVLENYMGPVLQVKSELHLVADQLDNLPAVLAQQESLRAENGYGVDLTRQVSWYREKVGEGEYLISFTVINEFYDTATVQSRAYVSGVTDDIVLTLQEDQIVLSQRDVFSPDAWVLCAQDADGADLTSRVKVEGTVNPSVPGTYTLRYVLTSEDERQRAVKELRVLVNEAQP